MDKKRDAVAYHEAGHVVAYLLTGIKFKNVTIKKIGYSNGRVTSNPTYYKYINVKNFFNPCFQIISGTVCEEIRTGKMNHRGAAADYLSMNKLIVDCLGSGRTVKLFLQFVKSYACDIFENEINWSLVKVIAEALLERETLTYAEVKELQINAITSNLKN